MCRTLARGSHRPACLWAHQHMSPEQAAGDRVVDACSDVYSLGAVVYELLIGEPPHTGINVQQVISRVLTEQPRGISDQRPTVPRWLNDAIMRSLAKLPADRFASAREFGDAPGWRG
ncbi:MAG: protein kinase [Gemmatimonadetes bacterium]|nr:protein kinase [Gemmatimonadota bacterium]